MIALDPSLLSFNGTRFSSVELDGEFWLRPDELGRCLGLALPEATLLALYDTHAAQFSERLTALAGVETPEGPRLMRVFNLLGAYVLCTFVDNSAALTVRRWLLETLVYLQIDVRKEIQQLRESQPWREDREWLEAEFRRWHEAQAHTAEALNTLAARIGHALAERRSGAMAGERDGTPAAFGDGVPVLTLPSQYHLNFHRETTGEPLTVMFWQATGPWFFVHELIDLLDPPAGDLADLPGFLKACLPEDQRNTARRIDTGEIFPIVTEAGLALLFERWSGSLSGWDRHDIGRWIADRVIPSALSLRLREVELDPERRPEDFPRAPTEVVADAPGLFKVYAGDLDGRAATLVNARDLYKHLGFRQSYAGWFEDRRRWTGFRNGIHYARVFVKIGQYDHYLTLDAADSLLCQESHPKAIEARAYLREVAREQQGRVIEGEAVRVSEGKAVTVTHCFDQHWNVRTVTKPDGETWWVAKDVCEALEYADAAQAVNQHCKRAKSLNKLNSVNLTELSPRLLMIPESDIYRLIIKSTKPEAERFEVWVMEEVLPTLRKTGRFDMREAPINSSSADTPPHHPLIIPFTNGTQAIPVRVAIHQGRPWFLAFDVALIVDGKDGDPRPAFAGVPEAYKDLRLSPDGESAALWLDEAGLAYFLGARPHKPAAERLRDWLLKEARPALLERRGAAPRGVAAALVPPEDRYTHRDPLYLACLALAERRFHAGESPRRRGGSAVSDNYGRFLAWLWREAPAQGWLDIENISRLARTVGIPRRSLARVIGRAVAWGFAEQRPKRPEGWPSKIRPMRARLEASLDAEGMAGRG